MGNFSTPPISLVNPVYGQGIPFPDFLFGTSSNNLGATNDFSIRNQGVADRALCAGSSQTLELGLPIRHFTRLSSERRLSNQANRRPRLTMTSSMSSREFHRGEPPRCGVTITLGNWISRSLGSPGSS